MVLFCACRSLDIPVCQLTSESAPPLLNRQSHFLDCFLRPLSWFSIVRSTQKPNGESDRCDWNREPSCPASAPMVLEQVVAACCSPLPLGPFPPLDSSDHQVLLCRQNLAPSLLPGSITIKFNLLFKAIRFSESSCVWSPWKVLLDSSFG